jgi:hypothetical protein
MKIVLFCSLLFYAALTEFVFGPVERAVTEKEPSLGEMWYNG